VKISFLIHTIYGIGGTIRTTLNLAGELAGRHEVEIVSVFRHRDPPAFPIDPRITVVPVVDIRPANPLNDRQDPLFAEPSRAFPRSEARYKEYNRLIDDRVRAHYAASDADVVIGTRPGLVAYVAQFAPASAVRIGQEHMTHNHHKAALREEMYEHLDAIDAFVTVSEGDAKAWRDKMPLPATRVLSIPNSVPEPSVRPSDGTGRTIVAAGRLGAEKQFDVLIDAFARVAAVRPGWTLRIHGSGDRREALLDRIHELGLYNEIHLMGPCSPMESEWVKGAVAASASRHESFGMTLVEAMRCGVPVVSADCDYGPREIITDGIDGLLVPVGDAGAMARGLLRLVDDEDLRRDMAAAAVRNARRFDPGVVAKRYETLFEELAAEVAQRARVPATAPLADCTVAPDGSLEVRPVGPLPAGCGNGARLVCVRTGAREEVRSFDLDAAGAVTLPATEVFPEGVWDVFLEPAAGTRQRVAARVVDQRGALRAAERVTPGEGVRHLLPYADTARGGVLSLRAWHRPVHAEVTDVRIDGARVTVEVGMLGTAEVTGAPVLVLRRRGGTGDEILFRGKRVGKDGFRFRFSSAVPAASQMSGNDVWDFFIRCAPAVKPVRIGRLLDDLVMKQRVFVYPHTVMGKRRQGGLLRAVAGRVPGRQRKKIRVHVYYTLSNDLAMNVADM
jgi:glycosyltransferase involved in cell wall biosynthesis